MSDFSHLLYRPLLHGTYLDEWLFAIGFVLSIALFVFLALTDRKREGAKKENDDTQQVDEG